MNKKDRSCGRPLNEGRLTFVLGALTAFAPFATDMYLSGFPSITRDLSAAPGEVQLTLSVFFFGLAAGQLIYGPLSDRFGRRRPLLAGVALYVLASALIAICPNILGFVALRLLQAVGGCAGMVISRAIIGDVFDWESAARALATMMLVQGTGPILAPVLGGYILSFAGWRMVFWFLVLFGGLCLAAVVVTIPESLPPEKRRRESPLSTLRIFATLLSRRDFLVPTLSGSLAMAEMFAFISGSPFVIMTLHGLNQREYGWLFALNAVGMTVAAAVGRILLRRISPLRMFVACLGIDLGFGLLLVAASEASSLVALMTPLCLCLAVNPLLAATSTAIAMEAGSDASGSASALIGVMQFGFASLASALVGLFHNGTAYPMTGVILGLCLLSCLILLFGRRKAAGPAAATGPHPRP